MLSAKALWLPGGYGFQNESNFVIISLLLLLKKHWVILPVACAVAVFMMLPQVLFTRSLGEEYRGIPRFVDDDAWYYLARAREVADGHTTLGNPYLAEHKNKPAFQFFIPDWLEVQVIRFFGTGALTGFLVLIPLLGFFNTILCYTAAWRLTGSRVAAVLASTFLFFGMFAKTFNRPTSPSFTMLFWFLEFHALYAFVRAERKTLKLHLANIAGLGVLFYVYPYFWSFYVAVIGMVWVVASAVQTYAAIREAGSTSVQNIAGRIRTLISSAAQNPMLNIRHLVWIFGGATSIALPYWYAFWSASRLPEYAETLVRFGVLESSFPSGIRLVVPGLAVLSIGMLLWRLRVISATRNARFMLGGVLGALLVVNQHVITGKHFEPSLHYVDEGIVWVVLAAAYLAVRSIRHRPRLAPYLATLAVLGTLWVSIKTVTAYVPGWVSVTPWEQSTQRLAPVLAWLGTHVEKDDVVFANSQLSVFIPVYTSANVLYNRNANLFFMRTREAQERFLVQSYFEDVQEAYIRANERALFGVRYLDADGQARQENKVRKLFRLPLRPLKGIPQQEITQVLERFRELKSGDFEKMLKRYHVDWLVWDTVKEPYWQAVAQMPFSEKVSEVEGGFVVFRVRYKASL